MGQEDDKAWEKRLEMMSEIRRKEFELEEEYKKKFLKVLSAKQVVSLFKAENEFLTELRKRVSKDRGGNKGPNNQKKKY